MVDDLGHRVQAFLQRERVGVVLRADVVCCFLRRFEVRRTLQSHTKRVELGHPRTGALALGLARESTLCYGSN